MLEEWHTACGDEVESEITTAAARLRGSLIDEEAKEVRDELYDGSLPRLAKELADLVYVTYGAARTFGIPLDAVIAEVHRSNMTKLQGHYIMRRSDGKILKPDTFEEADVEGVLANAN